LTYRIEFVRSAAKAYSRLDPVLQRRVDRELSRLSETPRGGVGIYRGDQLVPMAPPAARVSGLVGDLLAWLPIEAMIRARQQGYYESLGHLSARRLAEHLQLSQRAVEKHLAALQQKGRLPRHGSPRDGPGRFPEAQYNVITRTPGTA